MAKKGNTWIDKQRHDRYYKRSKSEGHRARSYYKLQQIDKKYHVLRINGKFPKKILDLGAAPGAWLEYIHDEYRRVAAANPYIRLHAVGIDLNSIKPFESVEGISSVRFDIFKPECETFIIEHGPWDVILSDLAPKTAGDYRDVALQEAMVQRVIEFCHAALQSGGNVAFKIFQAESTDTFVKSLASMFEMVKLTKPNASREGSRELYVVGLKYHK